MNRRDAVLALAALSAVPLMARSQQAPRPARIGYLSFAAASLQTEYLKAFMAGMRDLGYVEGRNLQMESRFADGDGDRLPGLASELVGMNVDVILSYATGVNAARRATATIPIVMANHGDPIVAGLAASLARPGGNVTGLTFFAFELMAKRLELLKEIMPSMTRAGVILARDNPSNGPMLESMGVTAKALKLELHPFEVRGPAEFEQAFSTWAEKKVQGLVVHDHAQFVTNAKPIAALAARRRMASIGPLEFAAGGGLMGYGVDFFDQFRRAAFFVDRILKGTRPGDLPIERSTKFVTVLNRKTAKALGITIAQAVLVRADEVIE